MSEIASTCTHQDCTKPIFNKRLGLCQAHYVKIRRAQAKEGKSTKISGGRHIAKAEKISPLQFVIPPEISEGMTKARTTEDWQTLGQAIAPIMTSILAGNVIASAAQVSLIKDIMNRAYGKPVATQTEKQVSNGVILLPSLDTDVNSLICPQCAFNALDYIQHDSTRELGVKVLRELLERLIADNKPKIIVAG